MRKANTALTGPSPQEKRKPGFARERLSASKGRTWSPGAFLSFTGSAPAHHSASRILVLLSFDSFRDGHLNCTRPVPSPLGQPHVSVSSSWVAGHRRRGRKRRPCPREGGRPAGRHVSETPPAGGRPPALLPDVSRVSGSEGRHHLLVRFRHIKTRQREESDCARLLGR